MLHLQHIKLNKNNNEKMKESVIDKKNELIEGFVDSLYYQIKLTEKYAKMLAKQLEEKLEMDITLDELTALATISQYNGEIHQRDLAKLILKDRANTGRMLNNLEKKGYIKREEKTKNKRQANIITVTDEGMIAINYLTKIIKPMFDDVHAKMKKTEIEHLKTGLINLRKIMKETIEIHI